MLRGLTRAGLGAVENEQHLIGLAASNGFQAVDLDALALIDRLGAEQAGALLQERGVKLGAIGLPVEWRLTEAAFREGLVKLAASAAAAASLGGSACCTFIWSSVDLKPAHFMALATRRIRLCAQILGAYGLRLGLEFVGPHHLRTRRQHPFLWTPQETLDWIEAIGEPNVGLLFDSYHWYTNGLTAADIGMLKPEQIVHVHINDAPDVPVGQALDNGRMYPGEGVIDLAGYLRGLQAIGYDGIIAQEILTPAPPADSPELLAQRSKSGFDRVFTAAGLA